MSVAKFYYEDLGSIEFAIKYTAQAISACKEESPLYFQSFETSQKEIDGSLEALNVLEENLAFYHVKLEKLHATKAKAAMLAEQEKLNWH